MPPTLVPLGSGLQCMLRAATNLLRHTGVFQHPFSIATSITPRGRTFCVPQPEPKLPGHLQPCWHLQVPSLKQNKTKKNHQVRCMPPTQLPPAASGEQPHATTICMTQKPTAPCDPLGLMSPSSELSPLVRTKQSSFLLVFQAAEAGVSPWVPAGGALE